jgi:5'(3')-deoxyribonucleotidase
MNKIIAVDLDEVLAETIYALLKKHNGKIANVKMSWDDFSSYNLWEIKKLNITKNKAVTIFFWFLL